MVEKILKSLIVICFAALVLTNPWFDGFDIASIPGWKTITDGEKIDKCRAWEKEAAEDLGIKELPEIVIGSNFEKSKTLCGEYQPWDNTIVLYLDNTDNLVSAYDTVCHEMRHAYQKQEMDEGSELGLEFTESYKNYIPYTESQKEYEEQLVEKDAREYARSMVLKNFFNLFFN